MVPSMSSVPMRPHPICAIWMRRLGEAPWPSRNDSGKNDGATIEARPSRPSSSAGSGDVRCDMVSPFDMAGPYLSSRILIERNDDDVAVVLQQDVARLPLAEVRPHLVLAVAPPARATAASPRSYSTVLKPFSQCSTCAPWTTIRARFHSPDAVEAHAGGRNQVVEAGHRAVAVHAQLGVGVDRVVEHLELAADRRARALVQLGVDEVLDAAVGALGDA